MAAAVVVLWRSAAVQGLVWPGLLTAVFLAAEGSTALWAVSEMEIALYALLVLLASGLYMKEQESGRGYASGFLFGLAYLARPEAALVFLAAALHTFWMSGRRTIGPRGLGPASGVGGLGPSPHPSRGTGSPCLPVAR